MPTLLRVGCQHRLAPVISRLVIVPILLVCGTAWAAPGDIYAYTDPAGVTHYSNVPDDARYSLLIAGPADTAPLPSANQGPQRALNWLAKAARYDALIDGVARDNTLDPQLVRAVIVVESGFNPSAQSNKGAAGLMQLRPETARRYGVRNVFDPEQNVRGGTRYLHDLMNRFGSNMELALAAYNAGEEAVEHYGRQIPPYRETLDYVPNVLTVYRKLLSMGTAARSS